jgi:SAM-dependent methyltransferase
MKHLTKRVRFYLKIFGFDTHKLIQALKGISFYRRDLKTLLTQKNHDQLFPISEKFPILDERFTPSGTMSGHYFHQDLLVARKILENKPKRHVDIGSRIDGFVAHVAVFREIEIFDIREQKSQVKNIVFKKADLMKLPEGMINYCDSISALHSIEHFGLGRYGDPIDYFGYLKAIDNITKILERGGKFYFSVPIGPQRIVFNAHRIFSLSYLIEILTKDFTIDSFSYVNDEGNLIENAVLSHENSSVNFNCSYGCGIFELTKK